VISTGRATARVPGNAHSGRVYIVTKTGSRSNAAGPVRVAPFTVGTGATAAPPTGAPGPAGTAFDGAGMWIWYVSQSNGGDPAAIASQALGNNVSTVFIKSGDGTRYWSQFSSALVNDLKSRGLSVCAWQYVYGNDPAGEAAVAARAKAAGADCFVIDAESEYEGKYDQARTYVSNLRAAVGDSYPIGLAGFPYVHYHPSYPYSVFLGPGGAQFNVPQIYWHEIGGGVDNVVNTTYAVNRPYGRPIVPIGQTYNNPPLAEITRFRQLVAAQGSTGVSWWSWQESNASEWATLGEPLGAWTGAPPPNAWVTVKQGATGDLVLWAQEHLVAAGFGTPVDGKYGASTTREVAAFQQSRALPATGFIDTATWQELLKTPPVSSKGKPPSANQRAKAREIPPQH
jgi:hypothetical protein